MNLYMVELNTHKAKESYVVAKDAETAYKTVRKFLDDKDLLFCKDRALKSVTLIASTGDYPECGVWLFGVGQ